MRIFKTKWFRKWAIKEGISDQSIISAVYEMEKGLIDADLGGNVYKKRVAKSGRGKSGGTRTIIAYKINDRAFFVYGFAKNKKDNISFKELEALKILADELISYDYEKLEKSIESGELTEVTDG